MQLASVTHTKQHVLSSNYTTTGSCTVGPVGLTLPSCQSDLLDSPALSLPELVFNWFVVAPDSATLPPTFTPPPSPLVLRQSLLPFWPISLAKDWVTAMEYKVIFDQVRLTGMPNYIKAKVPVPSSLNINAWRTRLAKYSDESLVDHLEFGWPLDYTAPAPPTPIYCNQTWFTYVNLLLKRWTWVPFMEAPFEPWFQ